MSACNDLLIEIGTEELPPKALGTLSAEFCRGVQRGLDDASLTYASIKEYATPRRLALLITDVAVTQPDKMSERRGPALNVAFKEDGCPTPAAVGFAQSCGVKPEDLETLETDRGAWLVFHQQQKGLPTSELLPDIVKTALDRLPIPKRMRWGALDVQFVRPVHWVVLLLGDEIIDTTLLGVSTGRETRGHRFHHPEPIYLPAPADYEVLLESEGRVIADFDRRRQTVRAQVEEIAAKIKGRAVIDENLLDEVTSMVEWPVAILGGFDKRFLQVPPEALISAMKNHQKYFHLVDTRGELLPHFITIANIDSKDMNTVRAGNERVIRPRLADAEFFWNQDRKTPLGNRLEDLKTMVFQHRLGSLHNKVLRMAQQAQTIAKQVDANKQLAVRACELCKCDLLTEMVGEFPELQGAMGRYYALHDKEAEEVATAIDQHYRPRFAGDGLPAHPVGQVVAIADRLDTLVGIFGIGQLPSGDKDPFALRRAALGVLRILIEGKLDLDLSDLLRTAAAAYAKQNIKLDNEDIAPVFDFMMDRLRGYYLDKDVTPDVFAAVLAQRPTRPADFDARIQAVNAFKQRAEAKSLAAANKRISNIIKKFSGEIPAEVNAQLLSEPAEQALATALDDMTSRVTPQFDRQDYSTALTCLSEIRETVDHFFDNVMVMTDDTDLRDNRLALLNRLRNLFLRVADVSQLQH